VIKVPIVKALVEGGKASAGPPLGPALGPHGVNIGQVVARINEATKKFEGMQVPVEVIINKDRTFEVRVGLPPTSALIKKRLKLEKGSGEPNKNFVSELTLNDVIEIAKTKRESMLSRSLKAAVKEVCGTCDSMGVKIQGMRAKDFIKKLELGEFDEVLKNED
jgi:large subunit ribosomal protein L11